MSFRFATPARLNAARSTPPSPVFLEDPSAPADLRGVSRGRRPWVLLVEDEQALARAVARGLRRRGFRVTWASTIAQAKVALASAAVDAVLLDVHLPDGHGRELLTAPTPAGRPRPRFVATSGQATPAEVRSLRRLGVSEFLMKPAPLDELRDALLGQGG